MTQQPLWVILCSLPEKRRREIEEIVEKMKEKDRGERKMNEREETEEIITFPLYLYLLQGQQALPKCKPISVGRPGDARYTTPLPHPTTPREGRGRYQKPSASNEYHVFFCFCFFVFVCVCFFFFWGGGGGGGENKVSVLVEKKHPIYVMVIYICRISLQWLAHMKFMIPSELALSF